MYNRNNNTSNWEEAFNKGKIGQSFIHAVSLGNNRSNV